MLSPIEWFLPGTIEARVTDALTTGGELTLVTALL